MGQHGTPQDDHRDHGRGDAPTTPIAVRRAGPLGSLHDGQRRWHPLARFAWWAFLLPVAIVAWSSSRLRGPLRVGGYVLAACVLLFGVAIVTAPAAPPPGTTATAPAGQVTAAQADSAAILPAQAAPAQDAVAPAQAIPAQAIPAQPVPARAAGAARPATSTAGLAPGAPTRHRAVPVHPPRPTVHAPARPRPAPVHAPAASLGRTGGDTYTNVDGNQVRRPVAAPAQPSGATAKCKDGTWSFSQNHRGTCSGHGGVARWL